MLGVQEEEYRKKHLSDLQASASAGPGSSLPLRPEDSRYYHPTLNPTGLPPPGKQASAAVQATPAGLANVPLPKPPPLPSGPKPHLPPPPAAPPLPAGPAPTSAVPGNAGAVVCRDVVCWLAVAL